MIRCMIGCCQSPAMPGEVLCAEHYEDIVTGEDDGEHERRRLTAEYLARLSPEGRKAIKLVMVIFRVWDSAEPGDDTISRAIFRAAEEHRKFLERKYTVPGFTTTGLSISQVDLEEWQ